MRLINLCKPVTETNVLLKFPTKKMVPPSSFALQASVESFAC